MLVEAGAVIGGGNDSGVPLTFPGMLHHELKLMTLFGATNAQALASATSVNARMMGLEKPTEEVERVKDMGKIDEKRERMERKRKYREMMKKESTRGGRR